MRAVLCIMFVLTLCMTGCRPAKDTPKAMNQAKYIAISLRAGAQPQAEVTYSQTMPTLVERKAQTNVIWLQKIQPGTIVAGTQKVSVTNSYFIAVQPVNYAQYAAVVGHSPVPDAQPLHYVASVSFDDIRGASAGRAFPQYDAVDPGSFLATLRQLTGLAHLNLPTAQEWDFAYVSGFFPDEQPFCWEWVLNCTENLFLDKQSGQEISEPNRNSRLWRGRKWHLLDSDPEQDLKGHDPQYGQDDLSFRIILPL